MSMKRAEVSHVIDSMNIDGDSNDGDSEDAQDNSSCSNTEKSFNGESNRMKNGHDEQQTNTNIQLNEEHELPRFLSKMDSNLLLSSSPNLEETHEELNFDESSDDDQSDPFERLDRDESFENEEFDHRDDTQYTLATVGTSSASGRIGSDESLRCSELYDFKSLSRTTTERGDKGIQINKDSKQLRQSSRKLPSSSRLVSERTIFEDEESYQSFARSHSNLDLRFKKHGKFFRRLMKSPCARGIILRFPRLLAIFGGIIIPLWMLNFLSLIFGVILAAQEAPGEILSNDAELAKEAMANLTSLSVTSITVVAPRLCAELFIDGEDYKEVNFAQRIVELQADGIPDELENQNNMFTSISEQHSSVDWTELLIYMTGCGESVRRYADEVLAQKSASERESATVDLTFNWIRCHQDARGKLDAFLSDKLPIEELSLEFQSETYKRYWEEDRDELEKSYYEAYLNEGMPPAQALALARNTSLVSASGGEGCTLNGPGAAFFWFTIMTTIGYGNQAPESSGGRALMYSLGFVSILAFGGILATAGTVSSAVFDDLAVRFGAKILTKPWCACLVWGSMYYGWMVLLAWSAQAWKNNRVEGSFEFQDGYWFAYLSTTTIGLGDVYLEPNVIIGSDLLYFPIMMLTGFVFLAAFLGKVRDLIVTLLKRKRATFIESLLMQMQRNKEVHDHGKRTRMAGRIFVTHNSKTRSFDFDDENST